MKGDLSPFKRAIARDKSEYVCDRNSFALFEQYKPAENRLEIRANPFETATLLFFRNTSQVSEDHRHRHNRPPRIADGLLRDEARG